MWKWFHQLASPPHFYRISLILAPWLGISGLILVAYGAWQGLFVVPMDYQQGDAFRIIYVHVPSAYLSMMAYMIMATSGAIGLIWRIKLSHAVAAAAAPIGAGFTFLALCTGSIWGRPMWGTWWEWGDPRMMSELILLFLYFGYMALRSSIDDTTKADKASAVLALVGIVNVVIVHFLGRMVELTAPGADGIQKRYDGCRHENSAVHHVDRLYAALWIHAVASDTYRGSVS